jgi:hypothetical protein
MVRYLIAMLFVSSGTNPMELRPRTRITRKKLGNTARRRKLALKTDRLKPAPHQLNPD